MKLPIILILSIVASTIAPKLKLESLLKLVKPHVIESNMEELGSIVQDILGRLQRVERNRRKTEIIAYARSRSVGLPESSTKLDLISYHLGV